MRQKNETATSFNQLQKITQAIQALKNGAPKNATNQESERTSAQTSENANTSEIASQSVLKPKATAHTKNHAIKPTKKAFSERQITAFRDNSQASAKKSLETQQSDKQGDNANAFKSDEAEQRGQE
ncbi:hypothetical protein [Helicobacter pylori]|uniref:hypothetical protein n=1 Tax=Helicobacter pylori TaxID=210 RepID=UPI001ABAD337|nr:hypothetical protein [Helicobacter pylori]